MKIQYMIHACPARMWYVEDFLLPSMVEQGISEKEIKVWNDSEGWGNLESFVRSMEWVAEFCDMDDAIWHIQDDVLLSSDFGEITRGHKDLAYGFANGIFDPQNWNVNGKVTAKDCWHSFQCICIPNRFAKEFAEWFRYHTKNTFYLMPFTVEGKMDDTNFRIFLQDKHPDHPCWNIAPNIVEHVDYLIGGTVLHGRRPPRTSAYWSDSERIRDLSRSLDKYRGAKPNKDKKYVCYSLTRNYYRHLQVSLASLVHWNPKLTKIFLLIEDDELPFSVPKNCEIINISGQTVFPDDYINASDYHTYACAIRVAHYKFLPEYVDRVLALDCDTIICDDLSSLWDIDLKGKWFAGGLELEHNYRPYGDDFYNGGVFLHNLDKQREDNSADLMVRFLIYNKVPNLDEEVLNKYAVPAGKAVPFSTRYNENRFDGFTNDPAIVHYVGIAGWWEDGKPRCEYWQQWESKVERGWLND